MAARIAKAMLAPIVCLAMEPRIAATPRAAVACLVAQPRVVISLRALVACFAITKAVTALQELVAFLMIVACLMKLSPAAPVMEALMALPREEEWAG